MRILHIHPSMLAGGVEAMICSMAAEMARQGHDVTVCSIYQPKPDDIFWSRLPGNVHRDTLGKGNTGFSLREVFAVYRYIRRGHFDARLPLLLLFRRRDATSAKVLLYVPFRRAARELQVGRPFLPAEETGFSSGSRPCHHHFAGQSAVVPRSLWLQQFAL